MLMRPRVFVRVDQAFHEATNLIRMIVFIKRFIRVSSFITNRERVNIDVVVSAIIRYVIPAR